MFTRRPPRERRPGAASVYLNVYDLTPINGYAYWLGLGVYHSGVEVHGVEYAYGAHEHPTTGIFEGEPRQCPGFAFRKSILIGRTDMGRGEVRRLVEGMAADYTGDTYNLISKNCNHFCNEACLRLTGTPIPKWVNRLAKIGFLCKCVLPVQVTAVRKREAEEEKGGVDGDRRRLRSNSARFPSLSAVTSPPGSISQPVVTISSRSEGGWRLGAPRRYLPPEKLLRLWPPNHCRRAASPSPMENFEENPLKEQGVHRSFAFAFEI